MKTLILVLTVFLTTPAGAQFHDSKFESIAQLYGDEERGLRYYERGEYDRAFEYLSETATRGLKKSQYLLAFMFLKGQHVDKSILLGMSWLGVAAESGNEEWVNLYNRLYASSNPAQQQMIDRKVEQYKRQYGMQVMNVHCTEQPVTGSRRPEHRCLKTDGPAHEIFPVELTLE
ncbi:SEL1-like repeat protein [Woeseia oceani]|uniref:Sel1 repeat family protein n=1 Tax=Woeseia oceani TaxID=1548547 RepID=A0A193LIG1_9GAMM|nr:sel1 repeat family protein [Woeseia oceani]ANO52281.1 hypothetical protein BA177_14765 [Woeseia oceani]